ncbi:MAG: hypothetical protein ACK55Z_33220 [bacterium]
MIESERERMERQWVLTAASATFPQCHCNYGNVSVLKTRLLTSTILRWTSMARRSPSPAKS